MQELRKITLANQGIEKKFEHVLDLAYGRKGKLKWELINVRSVSTDNHTSSYLLQPLLTDPSIPPPERIIPAVEKSRPPVYSKELTALLTSKVSHKNKPLGHTAIRRPPTLPARADLNSEDARLLGPLSKRREVNIYWRFYTEQVKRVYPPFQMILEERDSPGETRHLTDKGALHRAGIRVGGVQGEGVYEEIETLANAPSPSQAGGTSGTDIFQASPLRPRFLRRRFASLLGRTPVLVYSHPPTQAKEHPVAQGLPGKLQVSLSRHARHHDLRNSPNHLPEADAADIAWLQAAEEDENAQRNASRHRRAERLERMKAERTTNT